MWIQIFVSFTWTIVSNKLCFSALFILTIQIKIFTLRQFAEDFKDCAFCPYNLLFRIIFIINGVTPVSDFNRWGFVIERQCVSCEQGN
jgi:hypothetical protein